MFAETFQFRQRRLHFPLCMGSWLQGEKLCTIAAAALDVSEQLARIYSSPILKGVWDTSQFGISSALKRRVGLPVHESVFQSVLQAASRWHCQHSYSAAMPCLENRSTTSSHQQHLVSGGLLAQPQLLTAAEDAVAVLSSKRGRVGEPMGAPNRGFPRRILGDHVVGSIPQGLWQQCLCSLTARAQPVG